MILDEILALAESLYGAPASITTTTARVKLSTPNAPDRVNCARVVGETAERALARDLVANGEIAEIIARRGLRRRGRGLRRPSRRGRPRSARGWR